MRRSSKSRLSSMTKLSPQKEIIIKILRDQQWHCGRQWLNQIKDDRKRIGEMNQGYMKEKGYEIKGKPCRGHVCGVKDCPLFARRAVLLDAPQSHLNANRTTLAPQSDSAHNTSGTTYAAGGSIAGKTFGHGRSRNTVVHGVGQ